MEEGRLRGHSLGVEVPPPLKLCSWLEHVQHTPAVRGGRGVVVGRVRGTEQMNEAEATHREKEARGRN